jgi:hypothetical protein
MSNTAPSEELQPTEETLQALLKAVEQAVANLREHDVSIESPTYKGRAYVERFQDPAPGVKLLTAMQFVEGRQPVENDRDVLVSVGVKHKPGVQHAADPIDEFVVSRDAEGKLIVERFKKEGLSNAVAHAIGNLATIQVKKILAAQKLTAPQRGKAIAEREYQRQRDSTHITEEDVQELIELLAQVSA